MLKSRSTEREILDGTGYTPELFARTLAVLALINRLTNTHSATCRAFELASEYTKDRPLRVLDIGFGFGDGCRRLASFARRKSIPTAIHGIELNPLATELARRATAPTLGIEYFTGDVFAFHPERPYHLITCTQVAHHLSDADVARLLRWMTENCCVAWFVNDLHRSRLATFLFRRLTRLLSFNHVIRNDGEVSIARAFRREDWRSLIASAQIDRALVTVRWNWAFRYGVFYRHPGKNAPLSGPRMVLL